MVDQASIDAAKIPQTEYGRMMFEAGLQTAHHCLERSMKIHTAQKRIEDTMELMNNPRNIFQTE